MDKKTSPSWPPSKRYRVLALLFLGNVVLLCLFLFQHLSKNDIHSIPTTGGRESSRFVLYEHPNFFQQDERWKSELLGDSEDTLGESGCTITAVAMLLHHYGDSETPLILNNILRKRKGVTKSGLLVWSSLNSLKPVGLVLTSPSQPSHKLLDDALFAGKPVLAKILLNNIFQHWVLVVGKDGLDFLVLDPLAPEARVDKLSTLSNRIEALRVLKPIENQ